MKYSSYCIILFVFFYAGISCKDVKNIWGNNEFEKAINAYCTYADSVRFRSDFEYICIEGSTRGDSSFFVICVDGGSHIFVTETDRIIDFFNYKNHNILLVGDFPNKIVNISKNKRLDPIEDIVKNKYPSDYQDYHDSDYHNGPLIFDFKSMYLIFKKDKLIYFKFSW